MDKLKVSQSFGLSGEIRISGAKNAALPIMCAGLLTSAGLHLTNVPNLRDIQTLSHLLSGMGAKIEFTDSSMYIDAMHVNNCTAPYELVKTMRAAILVLGPLVARFGEAVVSLPGGCAIGARPVDQHINGLEQMGAKIEIAHGYIKATARKLKGARIVMDIVTVTGTENLLMAAVLASGTTILENCAREPEVTDLAHCLISMGARIEGVGTDTLIIHGVDQLHAANHAVIADRIEAGTYAVAAVMTQSDLTLTNARPDTMSSVIDKLSQAGAEIDQTHDSIRVKMHHRPRAVDIITSPYPAFPTDMQAQFMALNTIASGVGKLTETIFENRYMHVPELCRMGADIATEGSVAVIKGVDRLTGAIVMATDLRASASLVIAGLVAEGESIIERVYHLDRGYECIEQKLSNVGANISRFK